jgi:hypothetical protein
VFGGWIVDVSSRLKAQNPDKLLCFILRIELFKLAKKILLLDEKDIVFNKIRISNFP